MYQASIKNVTRGTWLLEENYGLVKHTKNLVLLEPSRQSRLERDYCYENNCGL